MLLRLSCRRAAVNFRLLHSTSRSAARNQVKLLARQVGFVSGGCLATYGILNYFKVGIVYGQQVESGIEHAVIVGDDEIPEIPIENSDDSEEKMEPCGTFLGVPMVFWKEVYAISKGQFAILAAAILSALASAYFNVKISVQIGDLINVISQYLPRNGAHNTEQPDFAYLSSRVMKPLMRLIFSYVAQSAATFSYITAMSYFGEHLGVELRIKLLRHLLLMDAEYYDRHHRMGELLNHITHDTQQFKSAFKQVVGQGIKNTVQMAGCVVSLVSISPTLAVSLGAPLVGIVFVGSLIGQALRKISGEVQGNLAKATAIASESIYGVATVRAFAMEEKQTQRYSDQMRNSFLKSSVLLGSGIAMLQSLSNLAINGMVVSTVFLGGWQIASGRISAGDLMSFLMASQGLQKCMAQTSVLLSDVVKGCAAASRMADILMLKPLIPYNDGKKKPFHTLVGDISFRDVVLTYKSRQPVHDFEFDATKGEEELSALKGINLDVSGGQIVAITGPSGAGKSTLAGLLERFYDPTTGSIFLDKIDLRLYDLEWLRGRAIGYVGQEPVLFAGSVADNIRFGKPDATDVEVEEAAKAASADEFIRKDLPDGYDTRIGERGVLLSGGQKQRIALARALIKVCLKEKTFNLLQTVSSS